MLRNKTGKFGIKELKLANKRGKDMKKLELIMEKLANGEKLEKHNRDHNLVGRYSQRRECHIEPDWLLIYKIEKNSITFERTGTHSDLFE
jgi:mRNA interferase YafQ